MEQLWTTASVSLSFDEKQMHKYVFKDKGKDGVDGHGVFYCGFFVLDIEPLNIFTISND